MVVLLTGATGFVGRHILEHLLERDVKVRITSREESKIKIEHRKKIDKIFFSDDIFSEEESWWAEKCEDVDVIIHSAWYVEPGKYLHSEKNIDCLNGTMKMAKGAVESGVRKIVGLGTCFEYDLSNGVVSIGTPLLPKTIYAASKAATFQLLSCYLERKGVEFNWCRLFYLYGDGEDNRRLIPYIKSRLSTGQTVELTSGVQVRDFMDIRDASKEIVDLALRSFSGVVNICSGVPITIRQIAEDIAESFGRKDLLRFGARKDNSFDPPCVLGISNIKNKI